MLNLVYIMVAISGFCLGWRTITDEGKVLYGIRKYFLDRHDTVSHFISYPFILCCACMASLWGTIIYWLIWIYFHHSVHDLDVWAFLQWILCCVTASFINAFCWSAYELVKKY